MPSQPKTKKKTMGRPPVADARSHSSKVRLTVAEKRKIVAAAKAAKQTESEWIRSTLIAAAEG